MRRTHICILCLSLSFIFLSPQPALGGAAHEAAMAVVHHGEEISDTGNLDAAMAEYDSVEGLYPEEYEAILWARFRKAECLTAGGRFPELIPVTEWIYVAIRDGKISNPDAIFWGASKHAASLDKNGQHGWEMAQTVTLALDAYSGFADPDAGKKDTAGWLHYWKSMYFKEKEQFEWARTEAEQAWELAKEVKNGTLAAWARLTMADALTGEGNLLLARQILDECRDNYARHEDETYRLYLQTSQAETELGLGLAEDTRQGLMSVLEQQVGEPALRIRAALVYADDAMARGATMEALGPLALIRSSLRHVPLWGDQANDRWERLRGRFPPELFASMLAELVVSGSGSAVERAAVGLQLADQLVSMGRGEEGLPLVEEAEALVLGDDRYHVTISLLKARCAPGSTRPAIFGAIDKLIRQNRDNSALVQHLINLRFPDFWMKYRDGYFGSWLDWIRDGLPANLYLVEKSRWRREARQDFQDAVDLANQVLNSTDPSYHFQAHVERIIALCRLGDDHLVSEAIDSFLQETPDQAQRDYGFFLAAAWTRDEAPGQSLRLADRVIVSPDQGVWWQEAMLTKARVLCNAGRDEEARTLLEELVSCPPLEGNGGESVGKAFLLLAQIHDTRLGDSQSARQCFEIVLDATDSMRFAVPDAYRRYIESLRRHKRLQEMITLCDRGLRELPYTAEIDRGLLRLRKCEARFQLGQEQVAIAAAEVLLGDRIPEEVRVETRRWILWARQQTVR